MDPGRQSPYLSKNPPAGRMHHVAFGSKAEVTALIFDVCFTPAGSTGRRNTRGQAAIDNDDGLPNTRPIAFSKSRRNQLSHNDIFFVAFLPSRNL